MKKKAIFILIAVLVVAIGVSYAFIGNSGTFYTLAFEENIMGSYAEIYILYDSADKKEWAENLAAEAISYAKSIEALISANTEKFANSDIVKFNDSAYGDTTEIDGLTYELLEKALEIYYLTEGAFNPAVIYLSDFWGLLNKEISNEFNYENPFQHTEIINEILPLTDFSSVELIETQGVYAIKKNAAAIEVDGKSIEFKLELGAIGKGFIADKVRGFLLERGCNKGYVSFGGSSICVLSSNERDGRFEIGLTNPRYEETANGGGGEFYAKTYCKNTSVSTSGDYQKRREIEGKNYCHIIGKDGYPISNNTASVTVITENAATGDALATAFSVMGISTSYDFLANQTQYQDIKTVFVSGDYKVYPGINLTLINSCYSLAA